MRRLRGRLRLSQPEVAQRGNLSLQTVWAIENGQVVSPQEGTLAGLAEALETTVEVLLGERSTTPVVDNGSAGGPSVHEHTDQSGADSTVQHSSDQVSSNLPVPADPPSTPAGQQPPSVIASPDSDTAPHQSGS